jgi:hypothetical protein
MITGVAAWRCTCGVSVKVVTETDRGTFSDPDRLMAACPNCKDKQVIHAHRIISVTVNTSGGLFELQRRRGVEGASSQAAARHTQPLCSPNLPALMSEHISVPRLIKAAAYGDSILTLEQYDHIQVCRACFHQWREFMEIADRIVASGLV